MPVPPRLRRLFDLWQGKVPQNNDLCITEPFFRYQSWLYVIEGLRPGFLRRVCSLSGMRREDFVRYRRGLHERAQSLDKVLPRQRTLLAAIHGHPDGRGL